MARFNSHEFERNLKKAFEKSVNDAVKGSAAKFQRALDGVLRSHSGRPVEEVKPVLRSALRRPT